MLSLEFNQSSGESVRLFPSEKRPEKINFHYEEVLITVEGIEPPPDEVALLVGELHKEIKLEKRIIEKGGLPNELAGKIRELTNLNSDALADLLRPSVRHVHQVKLARKSFINNLHWGDFLLTLLIDGTLFPAGALRRDKIIGSATKGGHFKSILGVVFGSPHGLIYERDFISNEKDLFSSGSRYRTAYEAIWYQKKFLEEFRRWNGEEISLPERVREEKNKITYSPSIRIDSKSLRSVARNPSNLALSPNGQVEILGRRFALGKVDSVVRKVSFDSNDARLLINTVLDVHSTAASHIAAQFDGQAVALNALNEELTLEIRKFCARHDLPSQRRRAIINPTLFRRLGRCKSFVALVDGWNRLQDLDLYKGESQENLAFPLNSLEKIWEFFCLERIIQAFELLGLKIESLARARSGDVKMISLRGRRGEATLFYEPIIRPGVNEICLNLQGDTHILDKISPTAKGGKKRVDGFRPDYFVLSTIDGVDRVGILDAKFSPEPGDWPGRTYEIVEKYCPWLRKLDGTNLDYCISLVPSVNHKEFYSLTNHAIDRTNQTILGCLPLRMQSSDPEALGHLRSFFCPNKQMSDQQQET